MCKKLRNFVWNIIAVIMMVLVLMSCTQRNIYIQGKYDAVVDTIEHTILVNEVLYYYQDDGDTISVTYPNGAVYSSHTAGGVTVGGWSGEPYDEQYISCESLIELLDSRPQLPKYLFWRIAMAIIGIAMIAFPYPFWWLSYGWIFRNAEPSGIVLMVYRAIGAAVFVFGVAVLAI